MDDAVHDGEVYTHETTTQAEFLNYHCVWITIVRRKHSLAQSRANFGI